MSIYYVTVLLLFLSWWSSKIPSGHKLLQEWCRISNTFFVCYVQWNESVPSYLSASSYVHEVLYFSSNLLKERLIDGILCNKKAYWKAWKTFSVCKDSKYDILSIYFALSLIKKRHSNIKCHFYSFLTYHPSIHVPMK